MPTTIDTIKQLLEQSHSNEVIKASNQLIDCATTCDHDRATALLLRGNAYRQLGDMRMAMNSYLQAREIEPNGPASMACDNIQAILNFYNKDLYNP